MNNLEKVRRFNQKTDLGMEPTERVNDLVSELGELSKEILKASDYGSTNYEKNNKVKDEFGDLYYCILCLADELNVDPDEALSQSLEKYKKRFNDRNEVGSGD